MPKYQIRAADRSGKRNVSIIQATDESTARQSHSERGWTVLAIKPVREKRWQQRRLRKEANASGSVLFHQLGNLLAAGVPTNTAVEEIQRLAPVGFLASAWGRLSRMMNEGISLVDAMENCPGLLAPRHIAVLNAGQSQNALAQAFIDIGEELAWRGKLFQRWKQVCTYPLFAIVLLVVVCLFMLIQVVPSLQSLLQPIEDELPWMTQKILGVSRAITHKNSSLVGFTALVVLAIVVALPCICWLFYPLVKKEFMMNYWLRSGMAQRWIWPFSVAVHAQIVHILLKQKIPLPQALSLAAPAAGWFGTQSTWKAVALRVKHNGLFADAIGSVSAVPKLYVSLIAVGEQYGTLDKSMAIAAEVFRNRFDQRLQRVDVMIGPALLVLAGSLIGMVFLWVILPVYDVVALQGGKV